MHDLAAIVPSGIWLTGTVWAAREDHTFDITISGKARSSENIGLLMKHFEQSGNYSTIKLLHSGSSTETGFAVPVSDNRVSAQPFEIMLTTKD